MQIASSNPAPASRWLEFLGWLGTLALLSGFLLNLWGMISAQGLPYLLLNTFGPLGVGYNAWKHRSYPAAVVELAWSVIALTGLARLAFL